MTRLLECDIAGLAGRSETLHLKFNPELNVFFGLNGSGKSSLLKILASALRDDPSMLEEVPFQSARVVFFSEKSKGLITRTLDRSSTASELEAPSILIDDDGAWRVTASKASLKWHTKPASQGNGRFKVTYLSISRLWDEVTSSNTRRSPAHELSSSNRFTERQLDRLFAQQLVAIWQAYTNRLLSQVRQAQEAGLADILQSLFAPTNDTVQDLPDVAIAYQRATGFLSRRRIKLPGSQKSFRELYEREPRLQRAVSDIDRVERLIEEAEKPRRKLQETIERFVTPGKLVTFADTGIRVEASDNEIPLSALSSGEKQLLRVLVETISAESSTIIIDEPELSMHIDWQRDLVAAMRSINPGTQIVLATHSPEIMAEIPDECITRL